MPETPEDPQTGSDFYVIPAETPEAIEALLLQVVSERIPKRFGLHPIRDVQVLTPMHRGSLGSRALNAALQNILNPHATPRVTRFGWTYAPGDKVIQTVNNYDKEVFSGDIGRVTQVDVDEGVVTVDFEGRLVTYELGELDEVSLAYTATVHKSQGSEYPAVVIPLATQHYPMLERNLLYTGVTRGKQPGGAHWAGKGAAHRDSDDALAQAAHQPLGTPSPGVDATRQAGGLVVLAIGDHRVPIWAFLPNTPASKRTLSSPFATRSTASPIAATRQRGARPGAPT